MVSAKKSVDGFTKQLDLVVKNGKITTGQKRARLQLINGHTKLMIVATSMVPTQKSELEYLSFLAKVPVHQFNGDCIELGKALKKNHRVSCVSVNDLGLADAKILFSNAIQA